MYSFTGDFQVRLRTSESGRYPGFSAYIVCFTEEQTKRAPEGTYVNLSDTFCLSNDMQNLTITLVSDFDFICTGTCTRVRQEDVS